MQNAAEAAGQLGLSTQMSTRPVLEILKIIDYGLKYYARNKVPPEIGKDPKDPGDWPPCCF